MVTVPDEILKRLPRVAQRGGFPPGYIHVSMTELCSTQEITWVKNYLKDRSSLGLAYLGHFPDVEVRMMLMAAAFTRNFVTARVVTSARVIQDSQDKEEDFDRCDVLLIPDFYTVFHGKAYTAWQISSMYSLLLQRVCAGLKSVLYIEDENRFTADYGSSIPNLINNHYTQCRGIVK